MRTVRVFVSSPSDVEHERKRVDRVVARLNGVFLGQARFETIRWETRFYGAHATFQAQIPEAAECDIVVAILWSRLGSELPPGFPTMEDGQPYPSGTAYEVLTAIRARETRDLPDVYVFRKTAQPLLAIDDGAELDRARAQWLRLRDFFERWFVSPQGHVRAAFQTFETTDAFEEQVEALLRRWIEDHVLRGRAAAWPIETLGSPFRGLAPFEFDSAPVFFGRSRDAARAIDRLTGAAERGRPFLLILGPSGSGKSSLARAGIAPRLIAPGVVETIDLWRVAILRPSDRATPIESLAFALFEATSAACGLPELKEGDYANADDFAALLRAGGGAAIKPIEKALARAATEDQRRHGSDHAPRPALLVVVDQLDDLFVASLTREDRGAFVDVLAALIETRSVWVVATLRAALYEDFLVDPKLAALKDSGVTYDLGFPVAEDLAEIVRAPALAAGLDYEKAANGETLDERLLRDAAYSDALPLLQFTLQRLFEERWVEDGRASLTFAAYEANGGIDGAIDQAARRALAGLVETEVAALPRLLRRLATPIRGSGFAAKGRFALAIKPAPLAEVAGDAASKRLVEALVEARILLVSVEANTPVVRLAHQRVLESWAQARAIVENQAEFYRIRGEVADQAQRWAAGGRRADLLLAPGLALAEAESVAERFGDELDATEREFVTVSGRRARLRQRLTFAAAVVFAVVAVASVALGLVAKREATKAEENYQVARQAANGLIVDIAEGLRNVEGMPATSVKRILATAKTVVDRLASNAPDDPDIGESRAQMLRQFALNYSSLGDLADASAYASAAVAEARRVLAQRPGAASQKLLAAGLTALGRVEQGRGALDDGRTADDEAIDIGKAMAATPSQQTAGEEIEARALIGLSDLEVVGGDMTKGLDAAHRSLDLARALSAAEPANTIWRELLATALERGGNINAGVVTAYSGPTQLDPALPPGLPGVDHTAALAAYAESSAIYRDLSAKDPTNTDFRFRLETVLLRIGDLDVAMEDLAGALAAQKEALSISSDLLSTDPSNADWKRRVEVNHEKLHRVYVAERDFASALSESEDALEIGMRLAELDPGNLTWRRDLCSDQRQVAAAKRGLKRAAESATSYAQAIAICRETTARFASDPIAKIELAYTLYQAGKGRPSDAAAPLWREAVTILDDLDYAGALPQAASNWAPFVRDQLAALSSVEPSK